MQQERLKKLEWVISELASEFIFESLSDDENIFGIITITKVKIASDLSYLDIYVSCFKNTELLTKTLAKHAYEIQKNINNKIKLMKTPRVRFRYDGSGEIAYDIEEKIKNLNP